MQKWEYKLIQYHLFDKKTEAHLNELGQEGWELVGLNVEHFVLKRKLP